MFLQNQFGQFYQMNDCFSQWVDNKDEATQFRSVEEAQKIHQYKFNGNRKIKVVFA